MPERANFLAQVTLFQDLDGGALATIEPLLTPVKYRAGSVIFRESEESDALYIVERGSVVVSKHVRDDVDIVLTRFHAGDFFGEMGLFDTAPRSASAGVEIDS
ncbi:MAG: cyclic nucleotide-binding domain-containing protein [Deltaproteobacteria bacterium]|nr:cyclic nucleotide-binding domain-containing protein [Deltaproteobacteria bacterium]